MFSLFFNVGVYNNNVFFSMSEVKQCYGKEIRKWCRSRCPEQCLRLGPDDINLYLGVTDRFHHFWRLRSVGVCVKISRSVSVCVKISISVGDLCQNLRAAGPKPEPVEVAKIHIHPGWDRSGLRMVTMKMGGRSSNSQNPDRHWHFIDSCLELTSTWLLKRNITWSRFTYKPLQRIIFWQKRGADFLKILRQGCKLDCCENYCHESVLFTIGVSNVTSSYDCSFRLFSNEGT